MDFFAAQERSKRTTRYLVLFFLLAFVTVAAVTALAVGFALGWYTSRFGQNGMAVRSLGDFVLANSSTLLGAAAAILAIMTLASLYRAATLSRGGGHVARMLGATEVTGDDPDLMHRRLINVVEEMAIASGLPVPEIYVLEQEAGINAFAAGLTHADAAVAVTRGALERLTRAELQGVIAHEFSHVLNGDMRLNQRLIGFSYGILVLSLIGRWLLHSARFGRRSRNSGVAVAVAIGAALSVIGAIGVLLSRLIKAAVSRQRERLADASAVQFTREPSALAGALKKIGGFTSRLTKVDDEEVAHMLFERRTRLLGGWLATHPPLVERIQALDPQFEPGDYPAPEAMAQAMDDVAPGASAATRAFSTESRPPEAVLERAGRIEAAALGEQIRAALPHDLYDAAHSRDSSLLLVLALAVSPDAEGATRQERRLTQQLGAARAARVMRLASELAALDRRLWLPLLEVAMPMIKQRPAEQLAYLFELVDELTQLDERDRLFEYVLLRVLAAYIDDQPGAPRGRAMQRGAMPPTEALGRLLGAIAAYGHADESAAASAYAAGVAALDARTTLPAYAALGAARDLGRLDAALASLAGLSPRAKRRVLESLIVVIRHDRAVTATETELFRAVAATLGCPSPPTLELYATSPDRD